MCKWKWFLIIIIVFYQQILNNCYISIVLKYHTCQLPPPLVVIIVVGYQCFIIKFCDNRLYRFKFCIQKINLDTVVYFVKMWICIVSN